MNNTINISPIINLNEKLTKTSSNKELNSKESNNKSSFQEKLNKINNSEATTKKQVNYDQKEILGKEVKDYLENDISLKDIIAKTKNIINEMAETDAMDNIDTEFDELIVNLFNIMSSIDENLNKNLLLSNNEIGIEFNELNYLSNYDGKNPLDNKSLTLKQLLKTTTELNLNNYDDSISSKIINGMLKNAEELKEISDKFTAMLEELNNPSKDSLFKDEYKNKEVLENLLDKINDYISTTKDLTKNSKNLIDFKLQNLQTIQNVKSDTSNSKDISFISNIESEEMNDRRILDSIIGEENTDKAFNIYMSKAKIANDNTLSTTKSMPKLIINKNNLEQDVIKTIKYMQKEDISQLEVKIRPVELGEILVKIISNEGNIKAEIIAKNKETVDLMKANINEIKKASETNGLSLKDVQISQSENNLNNQHNNRNSNADLDFADNNKNKQNKSEDADNINNELYTEEVEFVSSYNNLDILI